MKKSKRLLGIAAAGLIGAGSLFSGVAVTGVLQQAEVEAATEAALKEEEKFSGTLSEFRKLSDSALGKLKDVSLSCGKSAIKGTKFQ